MKRITKKDLALSLHAAGRSVEEIAKALETHPSYIANVLAAAGKASDYSDLYTATNAQSGYGRMFQGVLRFKDLATATESVRRIDEMYHAFEMQHDRRGQHQAQLVALIGRNRAEGIGKFAEAQLFADWLAAHLAVHPLDSLLSPAAESEDAWAGELALAS